MGEEEFFAKQGTGIWVEVRKRKLGLIKNYIARNVDTTGGVIKTLDPLVLSTIPKEHALFGAKHEFSGVVRTEIGPTCTAENT